MLSLLLGQATHLIPKPEVTTFPVADIRLANGQPDWNAKSNYIQQERTSRDLAISSSVAPNLEGTHLMGGSTTVFWRPNYSADDNETPEAAKLFTRVLPPATKYTYDGKAFFLGRNIVLKGGQTLLVWRNTTEVIWSEWHTIKGKRYTRWIMDNKINFTWEVKNEKGEIVRSGEGSTFSG